MKNRAGLSIIWMCLLASMAGCQKSSPPSAEQTVFRDEPKVTAPRQKNPDKAMFESGMDSAEIPLHRDIFEPFDDVHLSPDELAIQHRILNALWNTPLGQMYFAFLFDDVDRELVTGRSRQLVNRIFSEGRQVATRIAALQLLTEDLYRRNRMNDETRLRAVLLEDGISRKQMSLSEETRNRVVYQAAMFFLAALPFGSPAVREEAKGLGKSMLRGTKRIFHRGHLGEAPKRRLGRLVSREVFKDYQVGSAVNFFFSTFGPYSMLYFFWEDWLTAATGTAITDKTMLYGLDNLIRMAGF
jgi:hypothetical protein